MTAGAFFYQLFIAPLELLLESVYGIAMNILSQQGFAIFLMSMVMNILLLPLYNQADAIQAKERDIEKKMEPWVKHIRKTFKGDERFMMQQTYYRQNHYKPYYTLRSSLPLALQIPFFIAAYHFLSNLTELKYAALGPIQNLGAPDSLLTIGAVTLNLLPILMTVINIISSTIYTKGAPLKDKITLYGMALIFLVLLYDSPAGLVFYWTLNNLFSLVKNLFYRLKNPGRIIRVVTAVLGGVLLVFGIFFFQPESVNLKILVIALGLLLELPLVMNIIGKKPSPSFLSGKPNYKLFLCCGIILAVLTGVLIPSAVISSSPEEFIQLADFYSPLRHVLNASLFAVGTFIIWFGIFYYLMNSRAKKIFEVLIWIIAGCAIANYMFFGTNLGMLTKNLAFTGEAFQTISRRQIAKNLLVILAIAVLFTLLFSKKERLVHYVCYVLILAVACLSAVNVHRIQRVMPGLRATVDKMQQQEEKASIRLSKNGKNVVVMMMDRAISSYIPYMFQEKPGLKKQFDGFTWYPNTVSFGWHTNVGGPPLFGGYEYTPEEINKREQETLAEKHNEALKVMPVMFDQAGYEVTFCEPVYANYSWIPDLSAFDDYPQFRVFNTEEGQFNDFADTETQNKLWERNFFCYSLMKISPLWIQPDLYQDGFYNQRNAYFQKDSHIDQVCKDLSNAEGINSDFINSYSVLCALPGITETIESGNTFLALTNSVTHQPCLLNEPDYLPAVLINNTAYDEANQSRFTCNGRTMKVETLMHMTHYHVNMASLMKIGEWLDYLRANDLYDNTRIIIVADHGYPLNQFENNDFRLEVPDNEELMADYVDVMMAFNPLLLVKDFDAKGFTTDNSFMSNADVPTLATQGLIDHPTNPFTGKPIDSSAKDAESLHVFSTLPGDQEIHINNGNVFRAGYWYSVHDNLFDINNWAEMGKH